MIALVARHDLADSPPMLRTLLSALLMCALAAPATAQERVVVFAAASLSGPLQEIAGDTGVVFSFAGSGAIARQLAQGAPADLVILANDVWMQWLVDAGVVDADAVHVIAGNQLVVIGPAGSKALDRPTDLVQLLGNRRLAMGQRDGVPAGSYARQWLRKTGIWQALSSRLAETDNVRAALALVARGETPFGIVYASDARAEPAVTMVYAIPPESHDAVHYPAVALSDAGRAFLDDVRSPRGQRILIQHGFRGAP